MAKCAECGFLASRNKSSRLLEETEQETRESGSFSEIYEPPICFKRVENLWASGGVKFADTAKYTPEKILSIIQMERDCLSFTKWYQGFTPKEHQEMVDREARLKWQEEREEADRKWQAHQQRFLALIAGLFTILGGAIGVLLTILLSNH